MGVGLLRAVVQTYNRDNEKREEVWKKFFIWYTRDASFIFI